MVIGLDKFREQFAGEEDKYIIIGGTVCDVNLRDTNTEARDTVDIDIILIVENMTADFGRKFWKFIEDGGYHNRSGAFFIYIHALRGGYYTAASTPKEHRLRIRQKQTRRLVIAAQ